jgi:hypothetical protein
MDQAELATDILFKSRADLERVHPDLVNAAITGFGATDVMRFLGQKPHHAFTGEVVIDSKKRPEGCRIKFRIRRNSVKLYDHLNVLRIETTINNPTEFKILNSSENAEGKVVCRWCPMRKGVSNFWRYAEVAHGANSRLIDALANAPLQGEAIDALDRICRSQSKAGRHVAAFNPVTPENVTLFKALLAGEFHLNGFRNRDLQGKLYPASPTNPYRRQTSYASNQPPDRQTARPWLDCQSHQLSSLSRHAHWREGHVGRRPLPLHRLSNRFQHVRIIRAIETNPAGEFHNVPAVGTNQSFSEVAARKRRLHIAGSPYFRPKPSTCGPFSRASLSETTCQDTTYCSCSASKSMLASDVRPPAALAPGFVPGWVVLVHRGLADQVVVGVYVVSLGMARRCDDQTACRSAGWRASRPRAYSLAAS